MVALNSNCYAQASAFQVAKLTCDRWVSGKFEREVVNHFNNGLVVALPNLFLLAKVVELSDGRIAWLITHAIGELRKLIDLADAEILAPFRGVEWIALHRRRDPCLRVYRLDRFIELGLGTSFAATARGVTSPAEPSPNSASSLNDPRNPVLGVGRPRNGANNGAALLRPNNQ